MADGEKFLLRFSTAACKTCFRTVTFCGLELGSCKIKRLNFDVCFGDVYVTEAVEMNRTTIVPKPVLCYDSLLLQYKILQKLAKYKPLRIFKLDLV